MRQTTKWRTILLAAIFLLALIQGGAYGNHSKVQAAGQYGASQACAGHTLGEVNGCPACMKNNQLHVCENNFPDANFRSKFEEDYGEYIESPESITGIDVGFRNIDGLRGIEFFGALECLYCYYNQLTSLDVSRNTALIDLHCESNQLTDLDVSGNTALTGLYCGWNQLTELDVSRNTALIGLSCRNNQLTELNVSRNTTLAVLECDSNQLTELDTSQNTNLIVLNCGDNQLTELDVSGNTALTGLYCGWNQLTELDVSRNTPLTDLFCSGNQLTELDVSQNTALTYLSCSYNQLTELDVSQNTALQRLECSDNQLTELDVSQNIALTVLSCSGNQLTKLDVSQNIALTVLSCSGNQLTKLDVSRNTELTDIYCYSNQLVELDVRKNTALTYLHCDNNQLTELDVSRNTSLTDLYCSWNPLTELDVSQNIALTELFCSGNQLTELDVSKNTALERLWCRNNQLTKLDVSRNTELTDIDCYSNQLTELDVSDCAELEYLDCSFNQLACLDLSKNYQLYTANIRPQTIQVVPDTPTYLDMSRLVGRENLHRIMNFSNGSYDANTGILTLEEGVDHYIYEYDTQNAAAESMWVELVLVEEAVIDSVALAMGDRIDANIYLKVPEEAVAAVITYSYPGWKVPDVQVYEFGMMSMDKEGRYQIDVINIPAKELIETMTMVIYDQKGDPIPLVMKSSVGRLKNITTYVVSAADYANVVVAKGNEQQRKQAKALLNYGSMVQRILDHKTDNLAASDEILEEMKAEMDAVQVVSDYDGVLPEGDDKTNLGYQSLSLNLEGEIQILLSFSKKVTATMNGKALQVQRNNSSYEVVIPHIRAKNMDVIQEVKVTYGSTSFTFKVCALTYANRILATANAPQDYINLAKAMYIYQKETLALFGR